MTTLVWQVPRQLSSSCMLSVPVLSASLLLLPCVLLLVVEAALVAGLDAARKRVSGAGAISSPCGPTTGMHRDLALPPLCIDCLNPAVSLQIKPVDGQL